MTVLVVYATIEGQTGKIARFVEEEIAKTGTPVTLMDADAVEEAEFQGVESVILAAPVHERRHPRGFEAFLIANQAELEARRTLLLSVSLNAAFAEGVGEAQEYVTEMTMRTKLNPDETLLVAGAVRSGAYDYYSKMVLEHVVLDGREIEPSENGDTEFTDWDVLRGKLHGFLGVKA